MPIEFPLPPEKEKLNGPGPEHRILIVGRTGSGKSVAGMFHLSRANFTEMPWTIVDSKEESAFRELSYAVELDLDAPPPEKPGLYIVRPVPGDPEDKKRLDLYFSRVHANGNHGLFIDEGYLVFPARSRGPLVAIYTQGRTRRTPVIMNSQRPTWIGVEAISESSFFQVFDLTFVKDREKLQEFIPVSHIDLKEDYGLYRSIYHDVSAKVTRKLKPVRPAEDSIAVINSRLEKLYREQTELRRIDTEREDALKTKFKIV